MSGEAELALLLRTGDLPAGNKTYGRLIANRGLFGALARHGNYNTLHWLMERHGQSQDQILHDISSALGPSACRHALAAPLNSQAAVRAGTLLHGSAYLAPSAWLRRYNDQERAYSLVGTFFGVAVAAMRHQMMGSLLAPLHPWDAVICSSPSLKAAVRTMLDNMGGYMAERTGAQRLPLPQLPVIPIGVDAAALAARGGDAQARRSLRQELSISDDAVVVLWVGRLSWFDKAFPQPMLLALEQATERSSVPVHFLMAGWFPDDIRDRPRLEAAARAHAPHVRLHLLDGNDQALVGRCWAAADVFLSLSDTILETFGQAPVEAMAAGLPVVLSDWDGYRSLLRHGEEGLLIPTLMAPAHGNGDWLALSQAMGQLDHRSYGGSVAQGVAVNVREAAEALRVLIASPELRRRIGEAGRQRALHSFDWPMVVAAHQALFAELRERRRQGQQDAHSIEPSRVSLPPLGHDPFGDFGGYASRQLNDALVVRCSPLISSAETLELCELDGLLPGLRGSPAEHIALLSNLEAIGPCTVAELLTPYPRRRWPFLRMSLIWLAKLGRIDWSENDDQLASGQGSSAVTKGTK